MSFIFSYSFQFNVFADATSDTDTKSQQYGDVDMNVPVGESIQMYTALKLLGKETAMVLVDGQDHHILEYGRRVQWQNTIWAWFAKWLKDDSSWWEAIYPKKSL